MTTSADQGGHTPSAVPIPAATGPAASVPPSPATTPAGTDRADAQQLAARLAAEQQGRVDAVRALTFGAYLTRQWLPGKKLQLATTTYKGYERNVECHIVARSSGAGFEPATFGV